MQHPGSAILDALYQRQPDEAARLAAGAATLTVWEAAALGRDEALRALLEVQPALANAGAGDGHTPLGLASFFARPAAVRLLLEHGADPAMAAANEMKVQPLHAAIAGRDADVVRLLLARGADVNARQQAGYTALMGAAAAGRDDLVDLLLQHGADPAAVADDGRTAAVVAREHGHDALASRLAR